MCLQDGIEVTEAQIFASEIVEGAIETVCQDAAGQVQDKSNVSDAGEGPNV